MQGLLYNVVGEAVAVAVVLGSGLPEKLQDTFPKNVVGQSLITGASFALADDLYSYVSGYKKSDLIGSMDYKAFANTSLYNAGVFAAANATGVDYMIASSVSSVSPLPPAITSNLVLGGMVVGANVLRGVIAENNSNVAQMIVRPLSIVGW